jgi:tetratricopeptide (TPR) repeat protein
MADRTVEAALLSQRAIALSQQGRLQEAVDVFQRALAIWQELGELKAVAETLNALGSLYLQQQLVREALGHFQSSLNIMRGLGDRQGEASAVANLGVAFALLGAREPALMNLQWALATCRELGDREGEARALNGLGLAHASEDWETAVDCWREAITIYEELGSSEAATVKKVMQDADRLLRKRPP